jgi:hypothetical protein
MDQSSGLYIMYIASKLLLLSVLFWFSSLTFLVMFDYSSYFLKNIIYFVMIYFH